MALTLTKSKLKTEFEYAPISQKGEEKPFTVKFTAIPLDALAELQDAALKVSKDGEYNMSINTLNYSTIKLALTGWFNIEADDGPIRFKRDNNGATDGSLALIPGDIRNELATIIIEVSKDLPNAEEYLKELDLLARDEDENEDTEVVEEVQKRKPRAKKA